jgi:hypothetical protein
MIPDSCFRCGSAKLSKDNYLEIFKDVVSSRYSGCGIDESEEDPDEEAQGILKVLALPAGPKVLL